MLTICRTSLNHLFLAFSFCVWFVPYWFVIDQHWNIDQSDCHGVAVLNSSRRTQHLLKEGSQARDSSPLICVLVAERLYQMISKCRQQGLINDLGCRDETNVVINLHYADDTLIFEKECLPPVMVLKGVLLCHEKWFSLKINYHKICLIFLGEILANSLLSLIFNYPVQWLPITFWDYHSLVAGFKSFTRDHLLKGPNEDWQAREVTCSLSEGES